MGRSSHLRFVDLFAGLGGFHIAMSRLGHKCVFACDSNEALGITYKKNFGIAVKGDLRKVPATQIPPHDILCAGFPCQPFSKAGEQLGTSCELWGDLFSKHVLRVLRRHKPAYFIFENVANLERHDGGRTWRDMYEILTAAGYHVKAKVLSPHHFGIPQIRDRLFIVGSKKPLDGFEWPTEVHLEPSIHSILDSRPSDAKPISEKVERCLSVWNEFLQRAPKRIQLPSFPIWAMEFGATYPYTKYDSLHDTPLSTLRNYKGAFGRSLNKRFRNDITPLLPSYARSETKCFPLWKQKFIRQNRDFYKTNKRWIKPWLPKLSEFESCLQKLEWNCQGEERNIWRYVVQFRASGVRIKRPTTAPSLVAMTTTQVPIIAWEKRYMTPRECSRLQSMDKLQHLPDTPTATYKALGNAVNAEVVERIAYQLTTKINYRFPKNSAA